MPKVIWIDNTMPPTNYIWMKTDLNEKLIGVFEYIKDKWTEIDVDFTLSKKYYSRKEIDILLKYVEQEVLRKIAFGEYDIQNVVVDSKLSYLSENPVANQVITTALNSKQDKIEDLENIRTGALYGRYAYVKPDTGIRKEDLEQVIQDSLNRIDASIDTIENLDETHYTKEQVSNLLSDFITNTVDDLVNYYTKDDVDALLDTKQDTLVSGENIKTINNQSILGSGNLNFDGGGVLTIDNELSSTSENAVQNKVIKAALDTKSEFSGSYNDLTDKPEIKSRKAFKTNWPTGTTLEAFCQAVINDSNAQVGESYLGGLSCSGLPSGMIQGDAVVEVIGTDYNKVVKVTLTSTEVAPYHWEACYWQGNLYGWRSFELDSNKVTSLSASSTNTQYPSAKLVYDQLATKQPLIDSNHKLDYSLIDNAPSVYQKPVSGIPGTDQEVITLLSLPADGDYVVSDFEAAVCPVADLQKIAEGKVFWVKITTNTDTIYYPACGFKRTTVGYGVSGYHAYIVTPSGMKDMSYAPAVSSSIIVTTTAPYFKPIGGIPASDLADGVIPDVSGKQDIYSIPTAQITNPKEGDITIIAEEVKAEDLQDSENLSNISPNGGNVLRIVQKGNLPTTNCGTINIQGSYWGIFTDSLGSIGARLNGIINIPYVIDKSGAEHTINQLTGYDLSTLVGGALAADSISLTEVIGDGEQSLLPYVKIDSVKAKEIWEYKDGAWVNRRDFPTTFDNQPTAGSTSLVKSGGIATAIASKAQSYSSDPSSQPSTPKEGDIWDSPLVNSLVIGDLIGSFYRYMPDSHYQTKIVISSETPEIYVTKADDTIETIIDDSVNPKFYPAGEVKYVSGYGFSGIYNYQPAFCKVYHNDAWVDADSMFIDVEANPTVPSGTTPTDLTGLKVGNGYFDIPSLPTVDNTPTKNSTNLVKSGGVYSEVHPAFGSSQPAEGMLPNVVYDLGELTGSVTFALASPTDNTISNPYHWTFDTGSTAPTVNWPSGVIWPDNVTPTVDTGKHYEVLVRNGYGSIIVYTLPSA